MRKVNNKYRLIFMCSCPYCYHLLFFLGMVNLTENILELLYESVCADSTNAATKNLKMLQRGLEVCARRAMERFDDDTLLDIIR